jgi:riboflavin kinase / FMN adenylyltransferase
VTPAVVTLGVFDGVHVGHQEVVAQAASLAKASGARLIAFTFDPPPRVVLGARARNDPLLTPVGERLTQLRRAGVDEARVLRFDAALAAKSAEAFLIDHVFRFQVMAALVVGYDFALGRDRSGTVEVLASLGERRGFRVVPVAAVVRDGSPVSSSRIREALLAGRVEDATRWLGRPYTIGGTVEAGDGRGRTLGFPTANLGLAPGRTRPAQGVYAVWVEGVGSGPLPGVANLGRRPTFGGGEERLEVHVLAPVSVRPGDPFRIAFVARIRDELKFNNAKDLTAQIARDVDRATALLGPCQP